MPGYDRTGPAGQGPMTGRRMGLCTGNAVNMNRPFGMGLGMRRGMRGGRGFGYGFGRATAVPDNIIPQQDELMARIEQLEAELRELKGNK